MIYSKKGQAAAAAALLAVIVALIVLYILFIPPGEREKILQDGVSGGSGSRGGTRTGSNITLLSANPGRIDFLSQKTVEHSIPAIHLFTRTSGSVFEEKSSLSVRRTVFSQIDAEMSFAVADLVNTENVLLGFDVAGGRGILRITLNNEEVFSQEIKDGNVRPIALPKKLLEATNVLHFALDSPGIAFWRTHEYTLVNVKITGDVTRTDAQKSKNVFLVSPTEFNNLERVLLRFQPDCDSDFAGPIEVWINQFNVYSAVPDCGVGPLKIEVSPSYIKTGQNDLVFSIEQGDYSLSHVSVSSELKQIDFPVFFFELSQERFQDVKNNSKDVIVRLDFVDTIDRKQGELIVNGHTVGFDTRELVFEVDVSSDIVRGNNGIKIKPEKTVDVRQLRVLLVPQD